MNLSLANLEHRNRRPELMDQPGLDPERHREALRGLSWINWASGIDRILWRPLVRLARENPARPLRILDLATGAGDLPLRLWLRARRQGLPMEFAGLDVSPTAVEHARRRAEELGAPVEFQVLDALRAPLPSGYDVLTCSLFLHHLEQAQALELLRKMGQAAGRMVLVNDLIRCRFGFLLAWLGPRLLMFSPIVRVDAPLSVEAAFTTAEALDLARQAGLEGARISRHLPFRFLLQWRRPE